MSIDIDNLLKKLSVNCEKCCGLCCVALYFSKSDGFPNDKPSGVSCINLTSDFRCKMHSKLVECKMKGCLSYDCFGAGQRVTQTYNGKNWKTNPEISEQMFNVFLTVWKLHQMRWYLAESLELADDENLVRTTHALICENERMTQLPPDEIVSLDIDQYKQDVNRVLKNVIELYCTVHSKDAKYDFIGKSLNNKSFDKKNFSMALLIAANLQNSSFKYASFLGADLRDANIKGADLSKSIFLTQAQINSAIGSRGTKLPEFLSYPISWEM